MAPNAKCYQLLRAIGRKKCFLNIPMYLGSRGCLKLANNSDK